jgi:hypothetical protein
MSSSSLTTDAVFAIEITAINTSVRTRNQVA